jgi:hypothetical protein
MGVHKDPHKDPHKDLLLANLFGIGVISPWIIIIFDFLWNTSAQLVVAIYVVGFCLCCGTQKT